MGLHIWLYVFLLFSIPGVNGKHAEEKGEGSGSSGMLLLVSGLLVLAVLTIWLLKVKKYRFIHETGLCLVYGMIAGVIIKYAAPKKHHKGYPVHVNVTDAPLTLWASFASGENYSYDRKEELVHHKGHQGLMESQAVFNPEVFFYALLPPIIFFAGYDMKKRFFFRNLGAILTFAFIGTTISCVVFGGLMYGFVKMYPSWYPGFRFHECLIFGSLISATDPVTILAIFQDLNVEVDLYAMVFGESVMNDAVAIVLYRSILTYEKASFNAISFFEALGSFVGIFIGSFAIGCVMGLATALLTKLTKVGEFPRLETALFTLMSYSTFLIAEIAGLTGIVTVLFCGIVQAHYTYNNLTKESQVATKEIFGLLNFLAENFIFLYMGLTVFTFEDHQWDLRFIAWTLFACAISRACNIYPLSFLLNIKRSKKINFKIQHMLWFGGLRGAVAFALAIRNTSSIPRQLILTSVLVVAIATVVFNGSLTTQVLTRLGIRVNVDPNEGVERSVSRDDSGRIHEEISYERSWLVRKWHEFDVKYMKSLFTTRERSMVTIDESGIPASDEDVRREEPVGSQMEQPVANTYNDEEMIDFSLGDNREIRT